MAVRHPVPRAAFEAAYGEHVDFVWRALARHGVERAALEDATQEVFLVAHRHWGAWEGQASMRAWLWGVARRVASTHLRTRNRRARKHGSLVALLSSSSRPEAGGGGLDARLDDRARLRTLAAAIDALEPKLREVFVLADLEDMTAPAIAELLGCNLNTIYTRLRRARAKIRAAMSEAEGSDP
ncbi:hypothetical protein PPSIR1_38921 [Plesiocystis pacifica SIR-1]|uniref:Uncharacterized protein n=1 Tax=Plesiocystis pacifica SIR-1 TaxID=391625 RepID=A6GGD5_9BACT|nr:sigma-70 family RNA polymerase sigma factor [Plesiocystis pacifica]EDM75056.1 hypothetical protein PPSIR1_38921 [Plesiocystis pacifica SIR-1]